MKILGHRGIRQEENSRLPYQNTLEAIQYALEKSADGVELDVIASRDGKCFVIHDDDISKHGSSSGFITELQSEEIKSRRVGGDAGYKISALSEILSLFKRNNKTINIEIKQEGISDIVLKEILDSKISLEGVIVSSFSHHDLISLRNQNADVKAGLLFGKESRQNKYFEQYITQLAERLAPTAFMMEKTLSYLSVLESRNEKYFWTILKEDMENFTVEGLAMYEGVNFITDYPEELVKKLRK
jgi:glycerophosphoryl diester phosphodiesterase